MKLNWELDDEQKIILETFNEYCRKNIEPKQEEWIRMGEFPRGIMKDLSSLVLGTIIPFDEKNEKIDELTLGLLSETMGKYEFPVPAFLTLHFAKLLPYIKDEALRESYVKKFINGDLVICGAFTEPSYGSDSASIKTEARKSGEGYIISGEKAFVSSPLMADLYIVSARTMKTSWENRHKGISLISVNKGADGLEPYELESMASVFKGDFGGVRLDNVRVPEGNVIGEENRGFHLLMKTLGIQRVHVALYSMGLAERSLEDAIEYSKIRMAFGEPISKNQAISFRLAEDWGRLEASKLLAYKALSLQDQGTDNSAESAAVKWFGCESSFEAVSHSLQTFGASGYVKASPLERRFRTSRGLLIGDGTPDIQKLIIARKLLGKEYAP